MSTVASQSLICSFFTASLTLRASWSTWLSQYVTQFPNAPPREFHELNLFRKDDSRRRASWLFTFFTDKPKKKCLMFIFMSYLFVFTIFYRRWGWRENYLAYTSLTVAWRQQCSFWKWKAKKASNGFIVATPTVNVKAPACSRRRVEFTLC